MTVIENTTFRLADDIDEAAFLEADKRVQNEFIANLSGFVRRTTARGQNGEWLVVVLWYSQQNAESASRLAENDPVMSAFYALIDPASIRTNRYATLD